MEWYYWIATLSAILIIATLIPSRPNLQDLERFFIYPKRDKQTVLYSYSDNVGDQIIENFGFDDDQPADINLIVSGLNDCDAIIGTGDGKRDMFDFSNRFITAQIDASNDIVVLPRSMRECR